MRRWLRLLLGVLVAVLLLGAASGYWLYRAAQHVPSFYQAQLEMPIETLATAGDELEAGLLDLHNQVQVENQWRAEFSDDQINGWLAVDLPKAFPRALTSGMSNPRVSITDGHMMLACKIDDGNLPFVASMDVSVFMTDHPNVLGVRIHKTRIGAVPGLTNLVTDQISYAAWRSRVRLKWAQQDGDPVAMVTLPDEISKEIGRVTLESITLQEGRVILTGKTEPKPISSQSTATRGVQSIDPAGTVNRL